MGKRIEVGKVAAVIGTRYPPPFDLPCRARERRRLGDAAGLTQFGVNVLRLPPGTWSSQRHWHGGEDEFVYILEGEVVLVSGAGEELLRAGDAAGFKAGDPDGHCLQNRSNADAVLLEVGTRAAVDAVDYPDIDMVLPADKARGFMHRDGTPYPQPER
ncbi:MAG TPA: cupin domain-containing protein [Steroidobacteraceae bacterium]|nr:cupin domain-containing protein [Steroidobacteraceae bacterium]